MLMIMLMLTAFILFLTHPLSMGLILLLQTITISLMTGELAYNYWFSYILFLIMVGGMMILFLYMTSIASNEKFKYNPKILLTMLLSLSVLNIMPLNWNYMFSNNEFLNYYTNLESHISMIKYSNMHLFLLMMLMVSYLFIAMIASVKITNFKQGPLRSMN